MLMNIDHRMLCQVIVDTADYEQIEGLPLVTEATTNPSIVWGAAQQQKYFHLLEEACNVRKGKKNSALPMLVLRSTRVDQSALFLIYHTQRCTARPWEKTA